MLAARESAFSLRRRCNLTETIEDRLECYTIMAANSKMNLWRVNTVVLLHVLNASEAAATAWSNSLLVVSGTRVRSVCVDCCDIVVSQNKMRVGLHDELGPQRRSTVLLCSARTLRL